MLGLMGFQGGFAVLTHYSGGTLTSTPSTSLTHIGISLSLVGTGIPVLLRSLCLLALLISKRDPLRDGRGHIGRVLAES